MQKSGIITDANKRCKKIAEREKKRREAITKKIKKEETKNKTLGGCNLLLSITLMILVIAIVWKIL